MLWRKIHVSPALVVWPLQALEPHRQINVYVSICKGICFKVHQWKIFRAFYLCIWNKLKIFEWVLCLKKLSGFDHWGRVTHICVGNLAIIGSYNGLSPSRRKAITWSNAGILLIGPLGTNFSEIWIGIKTYSLKKIHLKMSSAKWRLFCFGLNVLILKVVTWDYSVRIVQYDCCWCTDPFHRQVISSNHTE